MFFYFFKGIVSWVGYFLLGKNSFDIFRLSYLRQNIVDENLS